MKIIGFVLLFSVITVLLNAQSGNVGIGTANPHESAVLELSSGTKGFKLPTVNVLSNITNPINGLMAHSGAENKLYIYLNGQWKSLNGSEILLPGQVPAMGDNGAFVSSRITNHSTLGVRIGPMIIKNDSIGITDAGLALNFLPQEKLHIQGKIRSFSMRLEDGAAPNRLLQSDAIGNASWVDPASIAISETDPQVSSSVTNRVPRWNGTSLEDGTIADQNGAIGINTAPDAGNKLSVGGIIKADGLRLPVGWQNGFILGSNSPDGFVEWKDISTIETDPQVSTIFHNRVPRYNAINATLTDGSILDAGNNSIEVQGDIIAQRFKMTENAATGKILVSENESGNIIWSNIEASEKDPKVNLTPADVARTIRWDGSKLQPGSMLDVGNGVQVTEIVPNSPSPIFNVTGLLSTTRFKIPTGAATNHVLKSDINGVGTWAPESDPKVNVLNNKRVARWNGSVLTDGVIQDDGQDVGIFTAPVLGQKLTVNGKTTTSDLQVTSGASTGFILTSDNMGNAAWSNPNTISVAEIDPQVSNAITQAVPRWNGTTLVDGVIRDDNTNIGIGIAPVANQKLTVAGKTTTDGLQIINGAGNNKLLRSDFLGNASWIDPASIETDPQVNMTNTNYFPVWNGTALVDAVMGQVGNEVIVEGNISAVTSASSNLRMTTGAGAGKILESDASGNASWVSPSLVFSEVDPKITTTINNTIPRWNGSNLSNGTLQDDGVNIGVGTSPVLDQKLTVAGNTTTTSLRVTSGATNGFVLQSDASGNGFWVNPTTLPVTESDPQVASTSAGKIPRWNGTTLTDGTIQDDATNVGIGTAPVINQKLTVSGKTTTTNLQMTTGAANGRVLQSDASGNASWVSSTTLSVTEADPQVSSSVTNLIPRWNGTALADGTIQDDATNVGIGTAPVLNQKLTVNGKTTTSGFQMTTGAAIGRVLQSDASGNATWVNSTTLTITETDPKISAVTTSKIPRWNGTALADGTIQDDATNVGIGTTPVLNQKLTVGGKTTTTNLQVTSGAASGLVMQSDATGNATWVNAGTLTTNNIYNSNGTLTSARTLTQGSNALAIANNGTQNTTVNLSSTGDFEIQDNGTSAFFVQDDGKVGINQPAPLAGLHIKGIEPSFDAHIRLESAADTDYGNILYDGNMKFRNFGAGDEYQWRNSANNTRMRLLDNGDLNVTGNVNAGGLSVNSGAVSLTADNQVVNAGSGSYLKLTSNSATATARTVVLADGLTTGQILYLESTSIGTNAFEILDGAGSNTNTSGTITMLGGHVLQLLWNGSLWLQVSYAAN